jgi:PKD repeat protein
VSVSLVNHTISATLSTADNYQWVDCNNGNSPISGATSQSFTATSNGNYAVEITVGNCTETSPCTLIQDVGLNELVSNLISIYPNPVNENLMIKTELQLDVIEIYTVSGELIITSNQKMIHVGDLAPGVYIVKCKSEKGNEQSRFVKQ